MPESRTCYHSAATAALALGTQEATMQGLDQSKQPLLLLLPSPPVLLTKEAAGGQQDTVLKKSDFHNHVFQERVKKGQKNGLCLTSV